jgi:membrane protein
MTHWWRRLVRALWLMYDSNCIATAQAAAYSGLLGIFPALAALAAVLVQMRARAVLGVLSDQLSGVLPPGTEAMVLNQFAVRGEKPPLLLVVAVLVAIWAASGFMSTLADGFNRIYKLPGRHWLRQYGVSGLLVAMSALPTIAASMLILFGGRVERWVLRSGGAPLEGGVLLAGQLLRWALAIGAVVLVTGLMYYWGPSRRQAWRTVWPGAWLATGLWLVATAAFAWYVRNIATYNVMYGSIGAVIALLVWMYLLALIACFGCAYNAAGKG